MAKRSYALLGAPVLFAMAVASATAQAKSDPFQAMQLMFTRSLQHAARYYPQYYPRRPRAHRPVLAKAVPDETPSASASEAAPPASAVPDSVLPIPEARPAEPPAAVIAPLPPPRPAAAGAEGAPPANAAPGKGPTRLAALTPPAETPEERPGSGLAGLAALGVKSIPIAPIEEGRCTVLDPVSIASLEAGAVPLSGKTILNDHMAEIFAKWVHDDVSPAAHDILKGELTGIRVLGGYSCRARYDAAGAGRMSEHGFGNAIDVGAFQVDKRWIVVGGDKHNAADDARFLDAIRHDACHLFTTVLGPGEPEHDTHFHLDLARHGKSGTYRICE